MEDVLKKVDELGANLEAKLKAANEAVTKENKEALKKAIEDVNKASEELFESNKAAYATLEGKMKLIAEEVEKVKKTKVIEKNGSNIKSALKAALESHGLIENYIADNGIEACRFKSSDMLSNKIQLKAAIEMTTALTQVPGTDTSIGSLTAYAMKRVELPISQDIHMAQVLPVKSITAKYFGVIVFNTEWKGAATTAENTAVGQSSFKLKSVEYKVHDIGCYFHVSKNELEDVDGLLTEIQKRAFNNINEVIDAKILGTNATDASDVQGLLGSGNYTAFSASTYAASVKKANIVDVLRKMRLQARVANKSVNAVLLNAADIDSIESLKDDDGNYPMQLGVKIDANGKVNSIAGLAIIENNNVVANTAIAIDVNESSEIGIRNDVTMEIGWQNEDITKRMVTIVFVTRLAHGIKDAERNIYSSNLTGDAATLNIGA
jgi:HK97 family phage major capsid protein